jgi:hypothetical protein
MKNSNSYSDFLKQENELTKLKIQAEFGFAISGESSLNPAIENIWLKQILDYERAMLTNKKITVRERLNNPVFKPVDEIAPENISDELQSVMELLHNNHIVIDSVAGVSDQEMYRFVVEEFLDKESDSNVPANMLTCYIYEEFHPNHEYDIRRHCQDLMNALEQEEPDFSYFIHPESEDEVHKIYFEKIKRKLDLFKQAFDNVKVDKYEITTLLRDDQKATVDFQFELSVLPAESKKYHTIAGNGKFTLVYEFEWWSIVDVEMKGVV